MNLKRLLHAPSVLIVLMLLPLITDSCKGNSEVTLATDSVVVEDAFKKSNGELCKIKTSVVITYPVEYKDSEKTLQLQTLYCSALLNATNGMGDVKAALNDYAKSIIAINQPLTMSQDSIYNSDDFEDIDVDNFEIVVKITDVYNKNGFLSFCCENTVRKNNNETSISHSYVNLDLMLMKKLSHSDLFLSQSESEITQMLKSKLLETNKVRSEDELYNSCGFFNLQNLSVTDNFFFSDDGITWCYEPGVIAVQTVGETSLQLPFEELMRFKCEDSPLNRL